MILQALYDHYQRLIEDPESGISPPGYSKAKVSFALVLTDEGQVAELLDLRSQKGKSLRPAEIDVPEQAKRTMGVHANFLCDTGAYVFGVDDKGAEKAVRAQKAFEEFRRLHHALIGSTRDPGLRALLCFLDRYASGEALEQSSCLVPARADLLAGAFIVFRLEGDRGYLHERREARRLWAAFHESAGRQVHGQCLITGREGAIAKVHQGIKGVRDAQSSGAALVSFNIDSFKSQRKEQSLNAPVSVEAMAAYTTAANYLLASDRQKVQIGDATTIFWAERKSPVENLLADLFNPPGDTPSEDMEEKSGRPVRDPDTIRCVHDLLQCVREGRPIREVLPEADPLVRFYVLGLAPNNARLAVRFWYANTLEELARRIGEHYADMAIERTFPHDPEFIPVWMLLRETAVLGKRENIPPLLGGALMRSILTGGAYPQSLFTAILTRIRADHTINYVRAAIVKACLARAARKRNVMLKEAVMTLIEESASVGYRLGRLFALLEKAQQDANPGINATIRDRYFGSASATPAAVFPNLIRLAQHHIAKAEYGRSTDKRIEEVIAGLERFPAHLTTGEQGLFILGYYHQRQALYRKTVKEA